MKTDYEPLFAPGIQNVPLSHLEETFVAPFNSGEHRQYLCERLRNFVELLLSLGIPFEIWVDGSFCTMKPEPGDIDLVVFAPINAVNKLPAAGRNLMKELFAKEHKEAVKYRYGCDAYFVPGEDANARSYWRGWFGFSRGENPKGIARLVQLS
ncbi:DUF6932 family protein [Desulfoferrobacter suflitae]|uniref:DUF6932 family protein n=1 Tax=Desulfoferrobacter suflitae TaxID=2865782 RepID=UPI0021640938|nr:hypothetical protein [Desulfoferrobacter suflitae]MCK8600071.1 hypothetical protein [Desulfoferrobacter suflitae]